MSLDSKTGDMEESPKKTTSAKKEDLVIKGLMKVLQDLADGQKETREFMGKIISYSLGGKHNEDKGESSYKGPLEEGRNSTKPNFEVITSRTNPQNRPQDYSEIPRLTMPKFLGPAETGAGGEVKQDEPVTVYF